MSTRSITQFTQEGAVFAIVYRHGDGYPEGAGRDINYFLKLVKKLKESRLDDPQYLAAKYVVYLAHMFAKSYESKTGKYKRNESPLDFISVGIVDASFDDWAYRYVIDSGTLDSKGMPQVKCFDDEGAELPIPPGKNDWQTL